MIPWIRKWQPIPVFLPGESHRQRILAGYSIWGHKSQTWLSKHVCHHSLYMYGTVCTTYDITYTIFDIVSTLCLSPNPLCWWYYCKSIYEISSSIYVNIISIVYNKIFTIFVPSHPLYLFLTPTLSMISHPLYIWHCTHYMFNIRYTI